MAASLLKSKWPTISLGSAGAFAGYLYVRKDIQRKQQQALAQQQDNDTTNKHKQFYLPEKIPYLLVGGGTSAHAAMRAIRGHDAEAKVLMVTNEARYPYMRPALSKELWLSEKELRRNLNFKWHSGKERSIFFEPDEFYLPPEKMVEREHGGVSLIKNAKVQKLDPTNNVAYFENGQSIKYDKCLLAPGGRPKSLPEFDAAPKQVKDRIIYFRTADDFLKLDEVSSTAKTIAIVGGGFLGTELAFALTNRLEEDNIPAGQMIYQIFPETGYLGKVLPEHMSKHVTKLAVEAGILPFVNVEILQVKWNNSTKSIEILLSNGQIVETEYIVAAVGLEPDIDLAKASQLEVDEKTGGYLVNSELEARSNIYVSGDASCFYDAKLGRRRIEHHDHAINSGRLAGQNMVGMRKPYTHQSMFWSDLGSQLSFEAVGIVDSSLPTVSVFADEDDEAVEKVVKKQGKNSSTENDNSDSNTNVAKEKPKRNKPVSELDNAKPVEDKAKAINAEVKEESTKTKPSKPTKTTTVKRKIGEKTFEKGVVFYLKDDVIVGVLIWNLFSRLNIARRIINEQKKYEDLGELAKLFNIHLQEEDDEIES